MAAIVLSLNCLASIPSTPISPQFPSSNFSSLKNKTDQRHTYRISISLKSLNHSSPVVHGLEKDSNPETTQDSEANNLGVTAALSMLRFYKREISPILPKSCRYVPTCSEYSMEAYKKYGVVKGTALTAWRICRCNPLGGSGYDPPRWFDETKPLEDFDD
ncbi:UPF0161 protein At3g09310 [Prosopis cineraria]|uniref:UPF0161 protein At3g09310 n=1 Tax=Prosopis cineraria TaxID=364024 RepID=UPI0024101E24|nr:UPF0161 protein At3g09310 [Prosopis cineraria]XP_054781470.1 UPF0161 protein At3g09310 [Prosopis cineraria]XP_054781471.1 UPF0161 protein At3g09310 [Prosopis cineraria]